jgi:DNA-binding response OmpR family regulator
LQRDPPHLIVLDLMLPGEDGLAVCRRLRGAGEAVPIIMLTAKGEEVDRYRRPRDGAPTITSRSRSIRASSSRASMQCCAGRPSIRAPGAPVAEGKVAFGPFTLDLAPARSTPVKRRSI